jgi:hypothetical protein
MARFLCVGIILGLFSSAVARPETDDPELSGPEKAAKEFSVGGVRLGESVEGFTSRYPTATKWDIPANSYPKNDVYELTVNNGTDAAPNVTFEFEGSQLKFITIMYSRDSLAMIEKRQPILTQLERRFGKSRPTLKNIPTRFGNADQFEWDFSQLGVHFSYMSFHDGSARFNAYYSVTKQPAKPKTSSLGFD